MRILIVLSGNNNAEATVRQGSFISQMTGATLTLLMVIKQEQHRAAAEAVLERGKTLLDGVQSHLPSCIRIGREVAEIAREAESGEYDLAIIGEPSGLGFARKLIPMTGEHVIARMPCPVLIARGQPRPLRRALVCESGRNPSLLNRLTSRLSPLLEHFSEMTVLHVMSQIAAAPGVPGWALRASAEELILKHTDEGKLLEEDLARLARYNLRVQPKVQHGLVVQEILAEARKGAYDLVVIGAHLGRGWEHFLLEDLARELFSQVDRPLLVV